MAVFIVFLILLALSPFWFNVVGAIGYSFKLSGYGMTFVALFPYTVWFFWFIVEMLQFTD